MTSLEILTQFSQLFVETKQALDYFNSIIENEIFKPQSNEDNQTNCHNGEKVFNKLVGNIGFLDRIIQKENEINEFFEKCKLNRKILNNQKNDLITTLSNLKKKSVDKEEWREWKLEWNKKREETSDEKNRRETEEMLEEIKEEKKFIEEMTKNMLKEKKELQQMIDKAKSEKNDLDIQKQFNKIANDYVKESEIMEIIEKKKREDDEK